jgi:transposase InsO family protein
MNAHIKSFHAILERDCYSINEFMSYLDVYEIVSNYMNYYNNRYRHGSLDDMSPSNFYEAIQNKEFIAKI